MRIEGGRIIDEAGRTLLLRGCNLGGSSKTPAVPDGSTWNPAGLDAAREVSFIGKPFPVEEADEHFSRLSRWGFSFLRFVITWEAVEHAGPGIYDESYLAYARKILKKAAEHGIGVFIDPHQDVWSRWTGGDGAPAWTMERLGFDLSLLDRTGAALTHQHVGDPYPRMVWPTNYSRYAAATMFTLFFAGDVYAPGTTIEGEDVRSWLQGRYFAAMRHAYRRLKDCAAIVGWGTMNEPHAGFIGYRDLSGLENCTIELGAIPSAFRSMAAASGHPSAATVYAQGLTGTRRIGHATINPEGVSLFKEGFGCPWKREGVWTDEGGEARLLRPDHFSRFGDRPAAFVEDFLKPFQVRFAREIRSQKSGCAIFIEGVPNGEHPTWSEEDGKDCVNAFHWYDGATLISKRFVPWLSVRADNRKPVFGRKAVARSFAEQLSDDVRWARERMGGMPCLLGEFGLPFDL
ncbi:MAG: cytoplasm protein, partial [Treponema sp. GWA1_62_8]